MIVPFPAYNDSPESQVNSHHSHGGDRLRPRPSAGGKGQALQALVLRHGKSGSSSGSGSQRKRPWQDGL